MIASIRWMVLAFLLALPLRTNGREPTAISAPVRRLATVPITVDADEIDYLILGADCDGLREYDPDPRRLRLRVIGYSPGVAFVVVTASKAGKLQAPTVVKVTFLGPGPPPPPDPKPPPVDAAWVVLIGDQDHDSSAIASVIASDRFRQQLSTWGLKFKVYDRTSPVAREKGYLAHAKDFPSLLILDLQGRVLTASRCPASEAGAIDLVRKVVGR